MVQSPSWEANWSAASQETPRISRNRKVHYRTHKRPPPVSILGQPNPVHIHTSHLLEIRSNIIPPSTPRIPQWSPSLRFPHQDPIHPSPHPYAPHAQLISFFSILSPAQYWMRSTSHLAPRFLPTQCIYVFCMDLRTNIVFPGFSEWFLGALAEMWKAPVSCIICPSAWNNLALTGRLFLKFDIWVFFENLSRKFKFHLNPGYNNGYLHEDVRVFVVISRCILRSMKTVSHKSCRENPNTHFISNNFFLRFVSFT